MEYPHTTNAELIFRLSDIEDQRAWSQFVEIYEPLILRTARQLGLDGNDARDATQEVLVHVARVVKKWHPQDRKGAFRGWLVRVARNQMLKLIERSTMLKVESGSENAQTLLTRQLTDDVARTDFFNVEFRKQVFMYVVTKIQSSFTQKTWQAFWRTYIDEQPLQRVAEELEISVGAIYVARSRVMSKLQSEVQALVDDEWTSLTGTENANPNLAEIRAASLGDDSRQDQEND